MCVCVCARVCVCVCVCVHACMCVRACMMYNTDQCHIHLNSFWFVCVWVCVWVCGGVSFRMMLCVGCFGGTVLYVCTEYHI